MIPEKFYQSVKSTIDYLGHQIASEVRAQMPQLSDLKAFTLDATAGLVEEASSGDPAIVWSLNTFDEAPVDPLYSLTFLIGPKTVSDVSGEVMTVLIGSVQKHLPKCSNFAIRNYSGPQVSAEPGETGQGYVIKSVVQEQMFDNQASVRMIVVSAVISRDIG